MSTRDSKIEYENGYFICIKSLYLSRGLLNYCRCPKCSDNADMKEIIQYYSQTTPNEPAHCDPFPDKIRRGNI